MKTIKLHGEVGWEIWGSSVVSQLDSVGGDDVTIDFSSPGGDVFEGVEIFNAFTDYKRKYPNAKIIFEVKGIAASMGSYIISNSVIDEVNIESNASYMIHNPWLFAMGDYKAMQKKAEFLEGLTKMVAPSYAETSGKSIVDIRGLMDDETWLFGQEIIDAGFADSIIPAEKQEEKAVALSRSKMSFSNMRERFEELEKQKDFDFERAAAILKTETPVILETVADDNKPAPVGNLKTEVPMNKEELKKDNPELYASMIKEGADNERENNNVRVKALTEMKAKDEYKDLPEVSETIDKAIMEGTTIEAVQPLIMAAMMKIMKDPARMATLESPGDIAGGDGDNLTPEPKKNAEV